MGKYARTIEANELTRYVDNNGLRAYLSAGRDLATRIAEQAGASIRIGDVRVVYDLRKIDEYMESLRKEQHES